VGRRSLAKRETFRLFRGFSAETLQFLQDLSEHNEKAWFEAHRPTYERHVLVPLCSLVADLSGWMISVDPDFEVRPTVGRTISRIFRDTRFSRDKSPLRTFMWIVFKRPKRERRSSPGFFFEIHADWFRYGMGMYAASRSNMDRIRKRIDEDPEEFAHAIRFHSEDNAYHLVANQYVNKLPSPHPASIDEWYQTKTFYLSVDRNADSILFKPELVDELLQDYRPLIPLYRFLAGP